MYNSDDESGNDSSDFEDDLSPSDSANHLYTPTHNSSHTLYKKKHKNIDLA